MALSMFVSTLLFTMLWIGILLVIDPIGRQFPTRAHPAHVTFDPPPLPSDPSKAIITLLHEQRTLSAIELYAQAHGCLFAEAQIKVLKIEATLCP